MTTVLARSVDRERDERAGATPGARASGPVASGSAMATDDRGGRRYGPSATPADRVKTRPAPQPRRYPRRSPDGRRPAIAPLGAGRRSPVVDCPPERGDGYRLGRWARLAITIAVVAGCALAGLALARRADGVGPTAYVTVAPGDTLWSLAQRMDPDQDPRSVVDQIEQLNGLAGAVVAPGVTLRVPVG